MEHLTTFEICMLLIAVLEGGVFIGGLAVSIKFINNRLDKLETSQEKNLKEYKEQNEKNISLLRDDMKRYNKAMERLAATEQDVATLKKEVETLHNLYNSAIDKITSCPHYNNKSCP
jgi:chromosome segregation ATPase